MTKSCNGDLNDHRAPATKVGKHKTVRLHQVLKERHS